MDKQRFFEEFKLHKNFENNSSHQRVFGASWNEFWLEHASYSLPEWQAVKLTFFVPWHEVINSPDALTGNEGNINPSSPNTDQHQFSPNNIHMLPREMVMRVNKMITEEKMLWSVVKLSQLIL